MCLRVGTWCLLPSSGNCRATHSCQVPLLVTLPTHIAGKPATGCQMICTSTAITFPASGFLRGLASIPLGWHCWLCCTLGELTNCWFCPPQCCPPPSPGSVRSRGPCPVTAPLLTTTASDVLHWLSHKPTDHVGTHLTRCQTHTEQPSSAVQPKTRRCLSRLLFPLMKLKTSCNGNLLGLVVSLQNVRELLEGFL